MPKLRNINDTVIVLKGKSSVLKQILNFHCLSTALSLPLEMSRVVSAASSVDLMALRRTPLRTDFKQQEGDAGGESVASPSVQLLALRHRQQ